MIENKYKNFNLYSFNEENIALGKIVIDKKYKIINKLKDTPRNFVAIIEINNKKYVLKEPRNEYRIPQRQLVSFFKDGESLSTLKNIHKLRIDYNFNEFVDIFLAGNKRKYGFIVNSFLLMEFVEGTINNDSVHKDRAIESMKSIHKEGFYHGDFNPSNFIFDKNNHIHILDTKGEKFSFGNFRAHYDMITMGYDSYDEMIYPYKKNFFYYLAISLKIIKRNYIFDKIKFYKKKLRDKGWKI
ncbi:MAG: lipopolysaccharide biosynthesis protein [Fusobacteriaceae bacterium]